MKRVILSRDKGDETIKTWLSSMGIEVLPSTSRMDSWIDGIVIGGGSDPGIPEDRDRDKMELKLIDNAIKNRIPVLGICRGAEVITVWAGGSLQPLPKYAISNHQSRWHKVIFSDIWSKRDLDVWSHHHLRIENPGSLKAAAFAEDGSIEAIADPKRKVLGVLWHPERSGDNGLLSVYPWLKWIEKRF
jgi:gamma-glutamyl-gamma-aminobutyrate hydrolase PuuD